MSTYDDAIAECLEKMEEAEKPLLPPCLQTVNCRRAGGCPECHGFWRDIEMNAEMRRSGAGHSFPQSWSLEQILESMQ